MSSEQPSEPLLLYEGELYEPEREGPLKKLRGIKISNPAFPVEITFLLSRHTQACDHYDGMEELAHEADVILLENSAWLPEDQEARNRISRGDVSAYKNAKDAGHETTFHERIDDAIYGSGKIIRFCDVPYTKKHQELASLALNPIQIRFETPQIGYGQMVDSIGRAYEPTYRFMYHRDKYILRTIYPTITEAMMGSPQGIAVRALFIIGAAHQSVAHALATSPEAPAAVGNSTVRIIRSENSGHPTNELYIEFLEGRPLSAKHLLAAHIDALGDETPPPWATLEEVKQAYARTLGRFGVRCTESDSGSLTLLK